MLDKKILIVGPIAPPFGGVSIHILRLSNLLKKEFKFDFIDESRIMKKEVFNIRSLNLIEYLKKVRNADLLYIHSGKNSLRIFHLLIAKCFSKKTIITIHSFTAKTPKIICYINGFLCRMANTIIIVNDELKGRLLLRKNKYILKEAFIPPLCEDEPELPMAVSEWLLTNKKNGSSLICANAYTLDTYNNEDLYGLDLCIEVTKRLLEKEIPVIFIFVVSLIEKNKDKYLKNQSLIKKLNLEKKFLLIHDNLSFVKLMESADIVLRPTNTDGDSLTVREALFLNKVVIASDVTKRPSSVQLFKNRNINNLEHLLEEVINKRSYKSTNKFDTQDKFRDLKDFYLKLIENTFNNKNSKILTNTLSIQEY